MKNMHEGFKKLNEEFKKTIAEMNASLTNDVDILKDKLKTEQVRQALQPFLQMAEVIKDLQPDQVVTQAGAHVITVMDYKVLLEVLK